MKQLTENPDTCADDPIEALKKDALDMVEKCIECGSCYVDCAFNNYSRDSEKCREWIRESNDFIRGRLKSISPESIEANLRCAECNRCYESCPENIYRRHGNMYMKHLTGNPLRYRINIHPYSNWRVKQPIIEKLVLSKWDQVQQDWYHGLNQFKPAEVLLYHGCYIYSQAAQCMQLEEMLDAAGVSYTTVGKMEYCCGTFAFYRGHSDMDTIKPRFLEMLNKVKPKRILTNCGHCYNGMVDLAGKLDQNMQPEVRHPVQELLELNIDRKLEFAHLGKNYTIHDSCNFRALHDEHGPLRSFLRRIGGIHEMFSHGKNGRCCGDVSRYFDQDHVGHIIREGRTREFLASGADKMVTVCAGCDESFGQVSALSTIDLLDVAYEAFVTARAEDMAVKEPMGIAFENMAPIMEMEEV